MNLKPERFGLMFSVIVPTYNEEKDISRTLTALEKIDWPEYEVIVVDDGSKDKTVQIVESFTSRLKNFKVILQPENRGVSSARNKGIKEARGEVVVILNADVLLAQDFLKKIAHFYREGKQWVAPMTRIINRERVYPRYLEAAGHYTYEVKKKHWVWTEGFSCTKEAAIQVGLFPEAMPGCSGEDVDFGLDLEKKYDGVRAPDIIVPHVAPDNLKEFWDQQKGRGGGRTNYYFYVRKMGFSSLFINSSISSARRFVKIIWPLPIVRAWRYSKYSEKGRKDFVPFVLVDYVREVAMIFGMWRAFSRIIRR